MGRTKAQEAIQAHRVDVAAGRNIPDSAKAAFARKPYGMKGQNDETANNDDADRDRNDHHALDERV